MNKALIVYLLDRKKKVARKDVESKHAIAELKNKAPRPSDRHLSSSSCGSG